MTMTVCALPPAACQVTQSFSVPVQPGREDKITLVNHDEADNRENLDIKNVDGDLAKLIKSMLPVG